MNALLVQALATLVAIGVAWGLGVSHGTKQDKLRSDLVISSMRLQAQEKTDEFNASQRSQEQAWSRTLLRASEVRTDAIAKAVRVESALRDARVESGGLRDALRAYAAPPPDPGPDALRTCGARAERLGERVDAGLRIQEELGGFVAACAATVRSLLAGWPSGSVGAAPLGDPPPAKAP